MIPLSTNEGFRRGITIGLGSVLIQRNYDVIALLNNDAFVRFAAFLPASICLRHGPSHPAKILRLCAKEAMRDHTRGRRVQYRDLATFRARIGVLPESTT